VHQYVHSGNFKTHPGVEKKTLEKAAMRMWLHTQVQKHYNNADWEAFKWNWLLGIRLFDLRNTYTKINYNGQYILMNKLNIYNNAIIETEENNALVDINEVDLSLDTWLTDDRLPNENLDE